MYIGINIIKYARNEVASVTTLKRSKADDKNKEGGKKRDILADACGLRARRERLYLAVVGRVQCKQFEGDIQL